MEGGKHEDLERRWRTLATLVELFEGDEETSCYGPDRAEHLLREQTTADELRAIGVGEDVIARIFGGEVPLAEGGGVPGSGPERDEGSAISEFSVRVEARFESAHFLRSYRGISEPLHGHSYRVEAELELRGGALDEDELAVDFVEAGRKLREIASRLDYGCINDIAPFDRLNPTAENVARWFQQQLQQGMDSSGAVVTEIRLFEGPVNSVRYRPRR